MKSPLSEHVTCQKETSQYWDWFDTLQWYKYIQQLLLSGDVCLGCPGASLLAQQAPKPTEPGTHYTDLSGCKIKKLYKAWWLLQNDHIDLIWCIQGCTTKINHWQTTQDGIHYTLSMTWIFSWKQIYLTLPLQGFLWTFLPTYLQYLQTAWIAYPRL